VQLVDVGFVARDTTRPVTEPSVEQPVLHVLGDLPGDEGSAVGPFADPPAPLGDHVLEHVDDVCRVQAAGGQVVQDSGPSVEQRVRAHAPMVPASRVTLAH
jgi:hypothetical protein